MMGWDYLLKNGLIVLFSKMVTFLSILGLSAVLARAMSISSVGDFYAFLASVTITSSISIFAINIFFVREFPRYSRDDKVSILLFNGLALVILSQIACYALLYCSYKLNILPQLSWLNLNFLFAIQCLIVVQTAISDFLRAAGEMLLYSVFSSALWNLLILVIVTVAAYYYDSITINFVIYTYTGVLMFSVFLTCFFIDRNILRKFDGTVSLYRQIKSFKFSYFIPELLSLAPSWLASSCLLLISHVSLLSVMSSVGSEKAAIYAIVLRLLNSVNFVQLILSHVYSPTLSRAVHENSISTIRFITNRSSLVMVSVSLMFGAILIFFNEFIILALYGEAFLEGGSVLSLLVFAYILMSLTGGASNLILMNNNFASLFIYIVFPALLFFIFMANFQFISIWQVAVLHAAVLLVISFLSVLYVYNTYGYLIRPSFGKKTV